ncbi:MAG: ABC transporter substrate-binding protein [Desulfovibrio sp.]|nr:ABC transporter substrate-binding protein [Desulfovibrio sp.]
MKKLLVVVLVPLFIAMTSTAGAADKARVGYWTSGVSLGYGAVLEAERFLEKQGLEVEFTHFPDVNAQILALTSDSIDLSFGTPLAGVFSAAAQGIPIKLFAVTQPADAKFVVPADSPIQSLADFKAKKIGSSPAGSSVAVIASTILARNYGITPADFTLVGGNESRLVQFLAQNQVDGSALRSVTVLQVQDELKLRVLGDFAEEWKKFAGTDAVPYVGSAAITAKFISARPEAVTKIILGLLAAERWGAAHPNEVTTILQKAGLPEKDAGAFVTQWSKMYKLDFSPAVVDSLKLQHAEFVKAGAVKGELNADLFVTGPFNEAVRLQEKR